MSAILSQLKRSFSPFQIMYSLMAYTIIDENLVSISNSKYPLLFTSKDKKQTSEPFDPSDVQNFNFCFFLDKTSNRNFAYQKKFVQKGNLVKYLNTHDMVYEIGIVVADEGSYVSKKMSKSDFGVLKMVPKNHVMVVPFCPDYLKDRQVSDGFDREKKHVNHLYDSDHVLVNKHQIDGLVFSVQELGNGNSNFDEKSIDWERLPLMEFDLTNSQQ